MNKRLYFLGIALLLSLARVHAQEQKTSPQGLAIDSFTRADGIPFAQGKTAPLLSDFYVPKGPGPFPGIVFIHGGGWLNGSRNQLQKIAEALAANGYIGMAIDYDVSESNEIHFPTALYESKEAVRWLRAHAGDYHVDPKRIAVLGSSAGGELAALLAMTNDDPKYEGNGALKTYSSAVQAAVIYNGVLDLAAMPDDANSVVKYLGGLCSKLKEECAQASPQSHIHPDLPPFYIGHGTADQSVPYTQFTTFVSSLKNANVSITEFTAGQGPHTYWSKEQWFKPNLDATLQFLNSRLRAATTLKP